MGLLARRRPLLRAAAVGGGAYMMGRRRAEAAQHEAYRDEAAPAAGQAPAAPAETGPTVIDQLEKLGKLHEQGILTDEEFAQQKAKLLS